MKPATEAQSPRSNLSVGIQQLISAKELSAALGNSERTIWRLLSGRRLPEPMRIGGSVRWGRE